MRDAVYQQSPGALSKEVEGEVLIVPELREVLDLDNIFYRLSDPVSVRVWALLGEKRTLAELTCSIAGEFEVDTRTASGDLQRFLSELVEAGAALRSP
jgi:hypothetical protein